MHWSLEIYLAVSIAAGLLLGGLVPDGIMPTSWRLPIGAFLVGQAIFARNNNRSAKAR